MWPGVKESVTDNRLYKVEEELKAAREKARLFTDTGCRYTLITPEMFIEKMGKVVPARRTLIYWGASGHLDIKGMFRPMVATKKGATSKSQVYAVAGHRPKPLLEDRHTGKLGIIMFLPEGREPTNEQRKGGVRKLDTKNITSGDTGTGIKAAIITNKLKEAVIKFKKGRQELPKTNPKDNAQASDIIEDHRTSVFRPGIGKTIVDPMVLRLEQNTRTS